MHKILIICILNQNVLTNDSYYISLFKKLRYLFIMAAWWSSRRVKYVAKQINSQYKQIV
jgi:hypothetical protein